MLDQTQGLIADLLVTLTVEVSYAFDGDGEPVILGTRLALPSGESVDVSMMLSEADHFELSNQLGRWYMERDL